MKQQVLDTCTLDGLENIVAFLKSHNIESKYVDFDSTTILELLNLL